MAFPYFQFLTSLIATLAVGCTAADLPLRKAFYNGGDVMSKSANNFRDSSCENLPGYDLVSQDEVLRMLKNNIIRISPRMPDGSDIKLINSPVEFLMTDGTHQIIGKRSPYFGKYAYNGEFLSTHLGNSQSYKRKYGRFFENKKVGHYVLKFESVQFCEYLDVELLNKE